MTTDFDALMAEARPAERTVPICLRGDLVAELEGLEREYDEARRRRRSASKEDGDPAAPVLARMEALRVEMQRSTYTFRLRASLPSYRALIAQHEPRRNDDGEYDRSDLHLGFNRETMFPELVKLATVDPVLSEAQWAELLGVTDTEAERLRAAGEEVPEPKLNYSQFEALASAAYQVNEGEIKVPFSLAALLESQSSGGE